MDELLDNEDSLDAKYDDDITNEGTINDELPSKSESDRGIRSLEKERFKEDDWNVYHEAFKDYENVKRSVTNPTNDKNLYVNIDVVDDI